MIIRKTQSQIKLVLALNNCYRVYSLVSKKVTWFRYKHQMLRHYGESNILIDIINSKVLNGEYEGKTIYLSMPNRTYKKFNGYIATFSSIPTDGIVLQNIPIRDSEATTLASKISQVLTIIRYLHGPRGLAINAYSFNNLSSPVLEGYMWAPRNAVQYSDVRNAQSTRPYDRHFDIRDFRALENANTVETTYTASTNTTTTTGETTYSAPREIVNHDLIRRYHSGGVIHPKNADNDNSRRYFGIELEIDKNSSYSSDTRDRMATKLHNILNENGEYNSLVKFENDGSLSSNGIEMIFQPMSYQYILEKKEKIFEALSTIDNNGYSSHDAGTCGLHIHVSRSEINNDTLDRILMIFENFKNELIAFSRRNEAQMRWCKFMCDNTRGDSIDKTTCEQARRYGNINGHHYVINNQNTNTVEFRLFRGTTNKRTFMAAIQLVDNIVSIAQKRSTIAGLTWLDIINYNDTYTELKAYNEKRNIYSTHIASEIINVSATNLRAVVLVRPHQLRLEGDN